jgi:DNA-binding SARP family transcriptional activator/pimeloyl-ACP methyl ester carboxylesterase
MEFRILGPLQVEGDGGLVELRGAQRRAVLASLILRANEPVSLDVLVEQLWPERAPPSAVKAVRVYVSQLRKLLGEGRIETSGAGYTLRLADEELDARRFERRCEQGRAHARAGLPHRAAGLLHEALALWRGPALADLAYQPFAQTAIARLEEQRLACLEERIAAELALGRPQQLIGELETLAAEHPLREHLRAYLMLALYRSGRQAEALAAYHEARRTLVDELGLEPGPALQDLERRILNHDPTLNALPRARETPHPVEPSLASATPRRRAMPARTPETRSGDVSVAYQVLGDGPFDVVYAPPFVTHVELAWQIPSLAAYFRHLASFCRLIRFDKRGTGMSDRVRSLPTLDTRMDDLRAVMDAAGSERAAIIGASEGGPMAILFAATYPDRAWALVLEGGRPRVLWAPDYPWGLDEQEFDHELAAELQDWGTREHSLEIARALAPSASEDDWEPLAEMFRQGASPGAVRDLELMAREIDVRHALPAIHIPVLVLNRTDEDPFTIASSRHLAQQIAGARHTELPGPDHALFIGNPQGLAAQIESFLLEAWADLPQRSEPSTRSDHRAVHHGTPLTRPS